MIKNNNYYCLKKQEFIKKYQLFVLEKIKNNWAATDILKKIDAEDLSNRQIKDYIYEISDKYKLRTLLYNNSKKMTNNNLFEKNKKEMQRVNLIFNTNLDYIINSIQNGANGIQISKTLKIGICQIENRLKDKLPEYYLKLKQNNSFKKSQSLKNFHQKKREISYLNYKQKILQFIKSNNFNVCKSDIEKEFGKNSQIDDILINEGLYNIVKNVGLEKIKKSALQNSKCGAEKIKKLAKEKRENFIKKYEQRFLKLLIEQQYSKSLIQKDAASLNIPLVVVQNLWEKYKDKSCKWENSKYYKNPMYGKQPSLKAGIGSSGWIMIENRKIFFRSTLQCQIYCYLLMNDIEFQLSKHKIPYWFEGKVRNYFPDINIGKTIFQIKPKGLINLKQNLAKFQAARIYCKKHYLEFGVLTQQNYPIYERNVNEYISALVNEKAIIFTNERSKLKFINARKEYERTSYTN